MWLGVQRSLVSRDKSSLFLNSKVPNQANGSDVNVVVGLGILGECGKEGKKQRRSWGEGQKVDETVCTWYAPCPGQPVPGYYLLLPHGFQHLCCPELKVRSEAPAPLCSLTLNLFSFTNHKNVIILMHQMGICRNFFLDGLPNEALLPSLWCPSSTVSGKRFCRLGWKGLSDQLGNLL